VRFSLGLPTDRVDRPEEFVTGDAIMECAAAAELLGFDACFVTDHPAPDTKWLAVGGHHALDPMVALAFAAASTTRLQLQTHIMVLAYRNPLLAAKSVLSLDVLSGGRVLLGVAAGYLRPEFGALGVEFEERNALTDEAIDVIRGVFAEDELVYDGLHFRTRGTAMRPKPARGTAPPIWIGGNSKSAIRRAVDRGDGWVPFPNPPSAGLAARTPVLGTIEEFAERMAYLRDYAEAVGRTERIDICFHPFSMTHDYDVAAVADELEQLAALGVTWCVLGTPHAGTRAEYIAHATRIAEDVVKPAASRR